MSKTWPAALVLTMLAIGGAAATVQAQTRWYAWLVGPDTLSLERFEQTGRTITGLWVTYRGAGGQRDVLRHEYTMAFGANDRPMAVHLQLRRPGGPVLLTYDDRFTDDSVFFTLTPDSLPPRRTAALRAVPILGRSMAMYQTAIASARAGKRPPDSSHVVTAPVTGPFRSQVIPVMLVSERATRLGGSGGPMIFTDASGMIDSLVESDGSVPLHRVEAFDIDAITLAASKAPRASATDAPAPAPSTTLPAEFEGRWRGLLEAGGQQLRVEITLGRGSDGLATATMLSVDQGGTPIPVSTVIATGRDVRLVVRGIAAEYRGTLAADGGITGQWVQNGRPMTLNLRRVP